MGSMFPQMNTEDWEMLISLPYRVGLYVSFADTSGGFAAQEAEMQSLSNILREFAEDYCKSEFSQKILMESMAARAKWPVWSQGIERVPDEASHILHLLENYEDSRGLRAFKEVLVEIAMAVAMAFRESHHDASAPRLSGFGTFLAGLFGGKKSSGLSHDNISRNERAALNRLCKAMNYQIS